MKPDYFIINSEENLGMVVTVNGHKVILMYKAELNMFLGMKLVDKMGNKIEDPEVEEILKKFLFWK